MMDRAAARATVPEFIAGKHAEDALEVRGAIQGIAKRRTVDAQPVPVDGCELPEAESSSVVAS